VGNIVPKYLKEKNALDIKGCVEEMDKLIYGITVLKAAFDMALLRYCLTASRPAII